MGEAAAVQLGKGGCHHGVECVPGVGLGLLLLLQLLLYNNQAWSSHTMSTLFRG